VRGGEKQAAEAVERANTRLAEFQHIQRWMLWPEPDLPRTSTGKVRRKPVAAWVLEHLAHTARDHTNTATETENERGRDWLYALVAEISGERPPGEDDLRLNEDFHLDSLGRVQLAAALEERLTDAPREGVVDAARTLGDLRQIAEVRNSELATENSSDRHAKRKGEFETAARTRDASTSPSNRADLARDAEASTTSPATSSQFQATSEFKYPLWPWWRLVQWTRAAFLELVAQPFVWFLGAPRVSSPPGLEIDEPVLIVSNHVTAYDGALVEYALPGRMRRWVAAAMLGEMLEDFRHFRDPDTRRFMLTGPAAYWLLTALYNVFPLPRRRGFQRSFAHAGQALDRGYNVLVFPEGTRSDAGQLAPFRPGIGLLVKQTYAPVLPIAILGLGELKATGRGWFRSGKIHIRVGELVRFGVSDSEAAITQALHAKVAELMASESPAVDSTSAHSAH
jgi:long-chain acyl-CoA synthetase